MSTLAERNLIGEQPAECHKELYRLRALVAKMKTAKTILANPTGTHARLEVSRRDAEKLCAGLRLIAADERTAPCFSDRAELQHMDTAARIDALAKDQQQIVEGIEAILYPEP
jgi:hypothetical protein